MDSRRRTGANRAATGELPGEQYQLWTRTHSDLQKFTAARVDDNTVEKVAKINKYISKFPTNDDTIKTPEQLSQFKDLKTKLAAGLEATKVAADKEVEILEEAIEHLQILLALRRPPENGGGPGEHPKRVKRIRLSSPAQNAHSPSPAPASSASGASLPRLTVRLPTRSGEREKAGGPLREGRRVAFRPPKSEVWILGLIKRHFMEGGRHIRYEVQDADTEEPGPPFTTDIRSLIPLPDPSAQPGSLAHYSSYPEFAPGAEVMAIYESTTSFYRAVVVAAPKEPGAGRNGKKEPQYRLQFDDDGGKHQSVNVSDVIEWPGNGRGAAFG
ncbi:hypothetical protein BDV93DRAFT_525506, partial [Ceratobasidium sp. AG-I]